MTPAEARERLARMTAASEPPVLDAAALDDLLTDAARVDSAGRAPTAAGWEPTYDLARSAADGWRIKAGLVAGQFSFTADGGTVSKGELLAHCERMIRMYARGGASVSIASPASRIA